MDNNTRQIYKIYSGRDNVCRCGCAGKYYNLGDKMFNSILKRATKKMSEPSVDVDDTGEYINISYGDDRAYTLYYK